MGDGINMQWHIALHHAWGTSHFMGAGAWLESNTTIGDLVGGLGTCIVA